MKRRWSPQIINGATKSARLVLYRRCSKKKNRPSNEKNVQHADKTVKRCAFGLMTIRRIPNARSNLFGGFISLIDPHYTPAVPAREAENSSPLMAGGMPVGLLPSQEPYFSSTPDIIFWVAASKPLSPLLYGYLMRYFFTSPNVAVTISL